MENIIQQIQTTMHSVFVIYIYFVHKIYILSFYHIYVLSKQTTSLDMVYLLFTLC